MRHSKNFIHRNTGFFQTIEENLSAFKPWYAPIPILRDIVKVPNKHDYDDFFFEEDYMIYAEANNDDRGNRALQDAYNTKRVFTAYLGYKNGERYHHKLRKLGVPTHFAGNSFVLGQVYISGKYSDDQYIIRPYYPNEPKINDDEDIIDLSEVQ